MGALGIMMLRRGTMANPVAGSDYIKFADEEVFNILMSNGVSSDGVGITQEDAEKVTSIGSWFKNNTIITSFNEFARFIKVTTIGDAFYKCSNLQTIDASNLSKIGNNAFEGCSALTSVDTRNVITIGGAAFKGCSALADINLEKLETINSQSFQGCSSLVNIDAPLLTTMNGDYNLYGCSNLKKFNAPNLKKVASYAFMNGQIEEFIGDKIETIGSFSFHKCTKLGGEFNKPVLSAIGNASMSSTAITSLIVPSIVTIGGGDSYNSALSNCKSLIIVDLGASCTSIGNYAFNGCTALQTFISKATTPPTLGTNGLNNTNNCPIYVPDTSVEAYKGASGWSTYADRIKGISEYNG